MEYRKYIGLLIIVFLIQAIPLTVVFFQGEVREGFSHGFLTMFDNIFYVMLVFLVGIWGSVIKYDAIILLPISFILMFLIGAFMMMDIATYEMIHTFTFGAIFLFAVILSMMPVRSFYVAAVICGSVGYSLGMYHMQNIPDTIAPLFFVIGITFSIILTLAAASCLGIVVAGLVTNILAKSLNLSKNSM